MISLEKVFVSIGYGMLATLIVCIFFSFITEDFTHETASAIIYLATYIGIMVFMFVIATPNMIKSKIQKTKVSLCKSCNCMTHDIEDAVGDIWCGKCQAFKRCK